MRHRRDLRMIERELFGERKVDTALQSFAHNVSREITRNRQPHLGYVEARDRRSRSLLADSHQECRQVVIEAAVEMIVGKGNQDIRMGLFDDLTRPLET